MANTPKKAPRTSPTVQRTVVAERRASARRLREQRRQRIVIGVTASVVGVAVLAVLIGILYDQVYLPSRPVASVGSASLTRGAYTTERRNQIARDMSSTLELITRFGSQFASQFAQRIPQLNTEADPKALRTAPVDDATTTGWVDRQLVEQGAAKMNIQASNGAVAQRLVANVNETFPKATAAVTDTKPTAGAPIRATGATTATASVAPTNVPVPTPVADVAIQQEDDAIQRIYSAYSAQMLSAGAKPFITVADFKQGLRDENRRLTLIDTIETKLVPDAGFTLSTEPTSYEVKHILVKVTVPVSATVAERDAAYAQRKPEAEAILKQVAGGADFATVAKEKSEDLTTKDKAGLLAAFDPTGKTQDGTQVNPAFLAAALKLQQPSQIADTLVRTPFGWHIIQLVSRNVPGRDEQLRTARSKAFDDWLAKERSAAAIAHFPPQTPTVTTEPTAAGTAQPLPTAPLGGLPTPITDTNTLATPAADLPVTPVAPGATIAPAATGAATAQPAGAPTP